MQFREARHVTCSAWLTSQQDAGASLEYLVGWFLPRGSQKTMPIALAHCLNKTLHVLLPVAANPCAFLMHGRQAGRQAAGPTHACRNDPWAVMASASGILKYLAGDSAAVKTLDDVKLSTLG